MPMYNLIEYSDNYPDSSATLYQYKRDEPPDNIEDSLAQDNSTSFSYKIKLLGDPVVKLNLTRKKECVLSNQTGTAVFIINDTNYTFQLLLCQKEIIKILLNNKIKVLKDLFIGTNIKQKKKMKMQMLMLLSILI